MYVADRATGRALTDAESAAVQSALQYFRSGGRRHNADEEESLFPRLRAQVGLADAKEIAGLEEDHRKADGLHAAVEGLYSAWIAAGRLSSEDDERLKSATKELRLLYEEHIVTEETIVFPRAAKLLDGGTIAAIGQEIRARRS